MSLRTRLIAILAATASFAIALAIVFQDRTLARDLQHAATERLERSAIAANRLVDAHLASLTERYRVISGTPQLRANLEVEDPPTLAHSAPDLQRGLGAERIVFIDSRGRVAAAAGDKSLDPLARGATTSRLVAQDGRLYALASVAVGSGKETMGRLVALEGIEPATLQDWSELCGATVALGDGDAREPDSIAFPVRSVDSAWLRVESRLDAEGAALRRSRELLLIAGTLALVGALAASLVLSRGLVQAMRQLLHAAERIGEGDFAARVSTSRVEAGELEIHSHPCRLRRLVEDAAAPIAEAAREKGLEFNFEIDASCPEVLQTDPARLRQVLANLLQNALKFTEHGSVSLWVGRDSPHSVCFAVRDTGIGIAAHDHERIFAPFGQADSSHTRRFGGAGLGLSISRRLATLLLGALEVSSDLGRGSEFRLTLPAPDHAVGDTSHEPAPERVTDRAPTAFPGARVLLAEDGLDNQRLVRALLRPLKVELSLVENGAQAVDQALAALDGDRPFELVLMDMQMPVMDGYEATRRLRAQGYSGPVVALTAHAMSSDRGRCLEAGCDEDLSKPIDRVRLLEVVAAFLAERKTDTGAPRC